MLMYTSFEKHLRFRSCEDLPQRNQRIAHVLGKIHNIHAGKLPFSPKIRMVSKLGISGFPFGARLQVQAVNLRGFSSF